MGYASCFAELLSSQWGLNLDLGFVFLEPLFKLWKKMQRGAAAETSETQRLEKTKTCNKKY